MKLCGHTMGTPDLDIYGAIDLFGDLGLEGIEVRCAEDGHINLETLTQDEAARIRRHAAAGGLQVACLTPYYRDFSSEAAREATLAGLRLAAQAAGWLDCGLVRILGGVWPAEGLTQREAWDRTVAGLREAADIIGGAGARLAVENHSGSLAMSAADTARLVQAVDHPRVGILFDYYWNLIAGDDDPAEAVRAQAPHIIHCHVKNLVWEGDRPRTTLLDEGVIDWRRAIACLAEAGYGGFLSDEYEKHWKPDLPEPQVGMARNARHLRSCLGE